MPLTHALEKCIGDEPHGDDDDEVELLAEEEGDRVRVVLVAKVFLERAQQTLALLIGVWRTDGRTDRRQSKRRAVMARIRTV